MDAKIPTQTNFFNKCNLYSTPSFGCSEAHVRFFCLFTCCQMKKSLVQAGKERNHSAKMTLLKFFSRLSCANGEICTALSASRRAECCEPMMARRRRRRPLYGSTSWESPRPSFLACFWHLAVFELDLERCAGYLRPNPFFRSC